MKVDNSLEVEPDRVLSEGRKRLLGAVSRNYGSFDGNDNGGAVTRDCSVYGDTSDEMTNSRLLARFLSRFSFYNPRQHKVTPDEEDAPSLDAAWAHWEHITLARYFTKDSAHQFTRAPSGEHHRPTALYPLYKTPARQLKEWGISVRLYFTTLLAAAVKLMMAGMLNVPLMYYFSSRRYAQAGKQGIDATIRTSAVCDEAEWVPCDDCAAAYPYPDYRLDQQQHDGSGYALKNTCDFDDWVVSGLLSYAGSLFLILSFVVVYFWLQRKEELVMSDDIQTTSDYSVKIVNPPKDALDPEEWKQFLAPFCDNDIVQITIAIDNKDLINTLIKRRRNLVQLKKKLPHGTDMNDSDGVERAVIQQPMPTHGWTLSSSAADLYEKVKKLNRRIKDLVLNKDYGAVSVFVIFDSERSQRRCLHALSTGKVNILRNRVNSSRLERTTTECDFSSKDLDSETLLRFRGEKVVGIKEANEPSDIRWVDLQVPGWVRSVEYFATTSIMFVCLCWSGFMIYRYEKYDSNGSTYVSMYITISNIIVPKICQYVNSIESHATEASRNISLYLKMAVFRWFNSAIALSIIMTFIETISVEDGSESLKPGLSETIYSIIAAEMFSAPVLKMLDMMGNIRRHILAPRAYDQEEMNGYFIGSKLELAERYSDGTKVIFVALFYSSIMPETMFLGATALFVHYWSGKFCLLRIWRGAPDIGFHLARFSRNYFFTAILVTHLVMSAYFWSGYPYDNVCPSKDGDDGTYQYCNQDMLRSRIFPPIPRFQPEGQEWMTDSQQLIASLYGWTSLVTVVVMMLVVTNATLIPVIRGFFVSKHEPELGNVHSISFSSIKGSQEVEGYIPQVQLSGFSFPLLACDLVGIDDDLVGWHDEFHGFEPHSLVNDVRKILGFDLPLEKTVFAVVKQWPV